MLTFRIPAGVHGEPSLTPPEPSPMPRCPICGEEAETFFRDYDGDVCGCENCVRPVDAWEVEE